MTRRHVISLFALVVLLIVSIQGSSVRAQGSDAKQLSYGDSVQGEITNDAAMQTFKFAGAEDDIVAVQVLPIQDPATYKSLHDITVKVVNSKNKKVVDSTDIVLFYGPSGTTVVAQLPTKGDYSITVGRGKDNQDEGKYTLNLLQVQTLEADKPVTGTIKQEVNVVGHYQSFYAVQSDKDFDIAYQVTGGDFVPTLEVNTIEQGTLLNAAILIGSKIKGGILTVEGSSDMYVVTVSNTSKTTFYTEAGSADYQLTLQTASAGAAPAK